MTGHFPIGALAWLFGIVTLAAPLALLYRFRRQPVIWLLAAGERRAAFHRDALAALEAAIADATAAGNAAEAARLIPHLAPHRRALAGLAASREFPGRR
jgi:hypothetical protein